MSKFGLPQKTKIEIPTPFILIAGSPAPKPIPVNSEIDAPMKCPIAKHGVGFLAVYSKRCSILSGKREVRTARFVQRSTSSIKVRYFKPSLRPRDSGADVQIIYDARQIVNQENPNRSKLQPSEANRQAISAAGLDGARIPRTSDPGGDLAQQVYRTFRKRRAYSSLDWLN